ncbi:MAG: hypothetical protein V7K21_26030 [Nostoc sp.]|uniref:hypothetical protein n=1 Tax=Nostoc sp. TaxID=1180 RepID=UPI002FFCC09C
MVSSAKNQGYRCVDAFIVADIAAMLSIYILLLVYVLNVIAVVTPTKILLYPLSYTRQPIAANRGSGCSESDIGLGQFAPRSQTVKDKAVHTACSVVELYSQNKNIDSKPGLVPALT